MNGMNVSLRSTVYENIMERRQHVLSDKNINLNVRRIATIEFSFENNCACFRVLRSAEDISISLNWGRFMCVSNFSFYKIASSHTAAHIRIAISIMNSIQFYAI